MKGNQKQICKVRSDSFSKHISLIPIHYCPVILHMYFAMACAVFSIVPTCTCRTGNKLEIKTRNEIAPSRIFCFMFSTASVYEVFFYPGTQNVVSVSICKGPGMILAVFGPIQSYLKCREIICFNFVNPHKNMISDISV